MIWYAMVALVVGYVSSESVASQETCGLEPWQEGPWGALIQDWVTDASSANSSRHSRVMAIPPAPGYYITDRMGPPPHHHGPHGHGPPGPHGPYGPPDPYGHGPPGPHGHGPPGPHGPPDPYGGAHIPHGPFHGGPHGPPPPPPPPPQYDEWQASPPPAPSAGKIVNRPPKPYKDQFKPSYAPPSQNQPIPLYPPPGHGPTDRVDEHRPPPNKQVSETDLYLLGAIEKLVYRVDLMEKRLRKMEENMHYLVAGKDSTPEPCADKFTRVGSRCYLFSDEEANWKKASIACRSMRANLLELDDELERRQFVSFVLVTNGLKGLDFWTGGLNPGLLWIWSHSARPVEGNSTGSNSTQESSGGIVGSGRCLALVHDPTRATYVYRGQDCALTHRYVCELKEDKTKLSNEIERVARTLKSFRQARTEKTWTEYY